MVYEILFVSEQKLKSYCAINFNVSPELLKPYVLIAQDLWLQTYLGSTFYDELKDQIRTNTLNTANRYLLDNFISQGLCNWALWKSMPTLWSQIINKGLMINTSESATATSISDMKFVRQEILNTAEGYAQHMVNYLRNHPQDYPAYIAPNVLDGDGVLPIRGRIYTNSLVVPKRPYHAGYGYYDSWAVENDCPECYEREGPGGYTT